MKAIMVLCLLPDGRAEMALREARSLGYHTVFCGEGENASIRTLADECLTHDWDDTAGLVAIARDYGIDGVVGLCDKATVPAAKIAKALSLPGNPPEAVETLLSKSAFRDLQRKEGLFCPLSRVLAVPPATAGEATEAVAGLKFPLIVKPLLCSSSFGQTVLKSPDGLLTAIREASSHSRNGTVCVEEYIETDSLRMLECDVFVMDGEYVWDGMRDSWRVVDAPLKPRYDVYPACLSPDEEHEFRSSVSTALLAAGARLGEFNIEGFFTSEGRFFIVEINPRQAGFYNPQHIELYCGVNLTKLLLTTAVGDTSYFEELKHFERCRRNILSYSVFSDRDGILDHVYIDPSLQPRLRAYDSLKRDKRGDWVLSNQTAAWPIAQVAFEFETPEELEGTRARIADLVRVVLQ
jgi:biotin carboxylase